VLPPALLIGASSLTASSMWVPRYVIFVLTPLCLLAAVTLGGLRWRTGLAVLATAALAAPAHVDLRGPAPHQGPDFRAATAIIAAGQRPGDGIVFGRVGTWSLRAGFGYHTRGRPAPADLLVHRSAAEVGQLNARECPEPATCLAGTSRVWYFGQRRTENPLEDLGTRNGHALRATHRLARVWRLERGTVALFGRR
jgi:mannosyltransferase